MAKARKPWSGKRAPHRSRAGRAAGRPISASTSIAAAQTLGSVSRSSTAHSRSVASAAGKLASQIAAQQPNIGIGVGQQRRQARAHRRHHVAQRVQGAGAQAGIVRPQVRDRGLGALRGGDAGQAGEDRLPDARSLSSAKASPSKRGRGGLRRQASAPRPSAARAVPSRSAAVACCRSAVRSRPARGGLSADQRHVRCSKRCRQPAISGSGRHPVGAVGLDQFAGHAPDDGGLFRLGDGLAALLVQQGHRRGAVLAHAGHEDADQLGGREMIHGAPHQPVGARMPRIVRSRRRRHRDQAGCPARHDQSRRRPGRYRRQPGLSTVGCNTSMTVSAQMPSSRRASAPVKRRRHVLRDQDRPRKSRRQRRQQRFQRRRPAGRGADQHQPVARAGRRFGGRGHGLRAAPRSGAAADASRSDGGRVP